MHVIDRTALEDSPQYDPSFRVAKIPAWTCLRAGKVDHGADTTSQVHTGGVSRSEIAERFTCCG
jgi:hypothetical protein